MRQYAHASPHLLDPTSKGMRNNKELGTPATLSLASELRLFPGKILRGMILRGFDNRAAPSAP